MFLYKNNKLICDLHHFSLNQIMPKIYVKLKSEHFPIDVLKMHKIGVSQDFVPLLMDKCTNKL